MYVCLYVCMYVCMLVCMSVFIYVRMYVSTYVCTTMHACMHACMCVRGLPGLTVGFWGVLLVWKGFMIYTEHFFGKYVQLQWVHARLIRPS